MKKNITSILLVTFLSIAFFANAQNDPKQAKKLLKEAQSYIKVDEFHEALPILQKAYEADNTNPEICYHLGHVYCLLGFNGKAYVPFQTAVKAGYEDHDGNIQYYYGLSLHANNKFDEAIKQLAAFRPHADPETAREIDRVIQQCRNGKELIKTPVKVKITNLGSTINSEWQDYGPVISADETTLLFTSRRPETTGGGKDAADEQYYEDIYMVTKTDSVWGNLVNLGSPVNSEHHDAVVGLSADGQKLLIYQASKGASQMGDLFISALDGSSWSKPKSLGKNINSVHSELSGSITGDEKLIFFSSDRPGGLGGFDIYVSALLPDGTYGPAVNLGPKINTKYNEDSPFIHPDGKTLYFSSKGHNSMGGYDVFSVHVDPTNGMINEISEVKNAGYPINTADDEIYFVWSTDGKRAYFASVRDGGYGDKDIYMLEKEETKAAVAIFRGFVFSAETKKAVAANITITDNEAQKSLGVYNSNSATGKYTVVLPAGKNYGIAVEAKDYLFYSKNIDIPASFTYGEYRDTIYLEPIKIGSHIVLRNVFFDTDKATLRPISESELDRLVKILKENPTIRIRIGSHTDSDGSHDYNIKLSDNRSKSVVEYLIAHGIKADRLEHKGYGETVPIAANDTPENKQLNRRTEFEIIK